MTYDVWVGVGGSLCAWVRGDKERTIKKERGKGEGETEKRVVRLQFFNTVFSLSFTPNLVPRSAHHGVRRGEARLHVAGRAVKCFDSI